MALNARWAQGTIAAALAPDVSAAGQPTHVRRPDPRVDAHRVAGTRIVSGSGGHSPASSKGTIGMRSV